MRISVELNEQLLQQAHKLMGDMETQQLLEAALQMLIAERKPMSMRATDLKQFFAELPKLDEADTDFMQDIAKLRALPAGIDEWD